MKNDRLLLCVFILLLLLASGCAYDPYRYKESRKIYEIPVKAPESKTAEPDGIFLINQPFSVLPFADGRQVKDINHGTSIPLSMLLAQSFTVNAKSYGIFKKIDMAPASAYGGQKITFDGQGFSFLKDTCKTSGFIWGNIYRFESVIGRSAESGYYDLTLFISGNLKMTLGGRSIIYNREFSKKRTYKFRSSGWLNYTPDDIYSLGPYFSNFIDWVMKGELDNIAINSKQIMSGSMIANDIIPDILSYPPENTKAYSFDEINRIQMTGVFLSTIGEILGGIGGGFIAYYAGGGGYSGGWAALLGVPVGAGLGGGLGYIINSALTEKAEQEALFYAMPAYDHDIALSINVINTSF